MPFIICDPVSFVGWVKLLPVDWNAISAVVLIVTGFFIWAQTRATKELVENDTRPVVEVSIMYERGAGTYVQFLNKRAEVPALVWTKCEVIINGVHVEEALESKLKAEEPWHIMHSAYRTNNLPCFEDLLSRYKNKEVEVSLEIDLAPLFLPSRRFRFYKKSYRLDAMNWQWIEARWGIPDKVFVKE